MKNKTKFSVLCCLKKIKSNKNRIKILKIYGIKRVRCNELFYVKTYPKNFDSEKSCSEVRYHKNLNILESDNLTNQINSKNRQEESEHKNKLQITTQSLNWFSYQTLMHISVVRTQESQDVRCSSSWIYPTMYCTSWSLYCHSFIKRSPRDFP